MILSAVTEIHFKKFTLTRRCKTFCFTKLLSTRSPQSHKCLNGFFLTVFIVAVSFLRIYTCQLFLRCRREIFVLGVLRFLKATRSFPKIPEEVRSLPKTSEVCRRRSYRENAYPQNQRSRGRYCHLFILHMVFVPYMGLS